MTTHGAKSWFLSQLRLSWPAGFGPGEVMAQQVRGGPAHPNGSRVWGKSGAGAGGWQRCSTCSLSPGITITRGGCSRCLPGSSGGREFGCCCSGRAPYGAALQAEGRCQRLRQPRVPHLGTAFYFFFQLHLHQRLHWFARGNPIPVTTGPPRCHPRGAEPVFGHGECHGAFLARGDLGEILSMRPSPSWLSM